MQHHAAVQRKFTGEQLFHFGKFARFQLGHKADVADVDAEQRQMILRRLPRQTEHGAVSAEHDRRVRKLHRVFGFHVIRVLNQRLHQTHLLGQHEPHTVTPQAVAHRLQDIACAVLAQIGIDENVLHHAFASSSSCA